MFASLSAALDVFEVSALVEDGAVVAGAPVVLGVDEFALAPVAAVPVAGVAGVAAVPAALSVELFRLELQPSPNIAAKATAAAIESRA
jgi:hypothetical protein